jgi:hypothetical protein
MSNDDLNIPESVIKHWEYENKEYMEDYYLDKVVEEVLGKEYLDNYEYRFQEYDKILKEKDQLVFEFFNSPKESLILIPEFF